MPSVNSGDEIFCIHCDHRDT